MARIPRIGSSDPALNNRQIRVIFSIRDSDRCRMRGLEDLDGTTLYAGPVEHTIGPDGSATAEYFDDISGTSVLTAPAKAGAGSSWRREARP